jgi:hypothetical protein
MYPANQQIVDDVKRLVAGKQYGQAANRIINLCLETKNKGVEVLPSLKLTHDSNPEFSQTIRQMIEDLPEKDSEKVKDILSFHGWK